MNGFWICGILSLIIYSIMYDWAYISLFLLMVSGYFLLSFIFVPASASRYNSIRRKIAIGTWSDPDSPECQGHFKMRIGNTLKFIEQFNKETGRKLTITHLTLKVVADTLKEFQDFNGKLAFGYFVPYDTIDVSCLVAVEGGKDLDFVCVRSAATKSLVEICDEVANSVKNVREGEGYKTHKKATSPFKFLPQSIAGVVMEISAYLATPLGIDLPVFGVNKSPCGNLIVTNVGSQGVEIGYAPFPSIMRVPSILALSSIKEEPVIENGRIIVDKVITALATIDHRYGDGTRGMKLANEVKKRMEAPNLYMKIE